jgi:hypothetical protein
MDVAFCSRAFDAAGLRSHLSAEGCALTLRGRVALYAQLRSVDALRSHDLPSQPSWRLP